MPVIDNASLREPPAQRYDAFLSYASPDRRRARRIHRFLERWTSRHDSRRLRVFFDETDIRGGRLDEELRGAVTDARTLIVCHSPASADSMWVAQEIAAFLAKPKANRLAVAVVAGTGDAEAVGRRVIPGAEVRVHDLRRGWRLAWLGLGVELELLRLLAYVADVDFRTLRNWHLRRTIVHLGLVTLAAFAPLWLLLQWPVDQWQALDLRTPRGPIFAICAEVHNGAVWTASWFRAQRPQGWDDKLRYIADSLAAEKREVFDDDAPRSRLTPIERLPFDVRRRLPPIDPTTVTDRPAAKLRFASELEPGRFVVVVPLELTDDERSQAADDAVDFGKPIPEAWGSLVLTSDQGKVETALIEGLRPSWARRGENPRLIPPSRGAPVRWGPDGELWLGFHGSEGSESAGLWHRPRGSHEWTREPGFVNPFSIELDVQDGRTVGVTVAEQHRDVWSGAMLQPHPTRVMTRLLDDTQWRAAPTMPPYGTRSEVELVGTLDGARLVRVDERIFRHHRVALWRWLTSR
jgi:hypothetical protein